MKTRNLYSGTLFLFCACALLIGLMNSCASMKNEDTVTEAPNISQGSKNESGTEENQPTLPHPSDVIPGFPEVDWSMKSEEVLAVLESEGYFPETMVPTQVAWEGDFDGVDGIGTVSMKDPGGVVLIGVEIPNSGGTPDLAKAWEDRLVEAYGPQTEEGEDLSWSIEGGTVLHFTRTSGSGMRLEWRHETL